MKLNETPVIITRSYRAVDPHPDVPHEGECPWHAEVDPDFTVEDLADWLGPYFDVKVDDKLGKLQLKYDYMMWQWDFEHPHSHTAYETEGIELKQRAEALGVDLEDL